VTRVSATPAGTLVLDSEGLAKAVLRAREVTQWLALARADDLRVITSAATVVEVAHPRLSRPALEWTLSRVVVEPVTEPIARRATAILAEAGLHGHRHAIDAMLSATALAAPGPVTVLTSDPEDIATLCGWKVTVIKVLRAVRAIDSRSAWREASGTSWLSCNEAGWDTLSATMAGVR
jgi:predicted nucleic acid-binding protein